MKLIDYTDRDAMMMALANILAGELAQTLMTHPHASLAVPGGTTPGPIFDTLCAADLEWERVHVLLTDERWVPETHARSNTGLLRARLLTGRAARATYVPLYQAAETPEEVLAELEERVRPELPLSVLLLGMGADMHTASLFPGADRLEEALGDDAPILLPMRAPGAGEPRITLTAPVLRAAMRIHIVITGEEKRRALEVAQGADPLTAPVATVLRDATVHWAP